MERQDWIVEPLPELSTHLLSVACVLNCSFYMLIYLLPIIVEVESGQRKSHLRTPHFERKGDGSAFFCPPTTVTLSIFFSPWTIPQEELRNLGRLIGERGGKPLLPVTEHGTAQKVGIMCKKRARWWENIKALFFFFACCYQNPATWDKRG